MAPALRPVRPPADTHAAPASTNRHGGKTDAGEDGSGIMPTFTGVNTLFTPTIPIMPHRLSLLFMGLCLTAGGPLPLSGQTIDAPNLTPLPAESKAAAVDVTLTGTLTTAGNSDFRQLRDLCYRLERLDLSAATCPGIPKNALHSRHRLKQLRLPRGVRSIGSQAFFACDSLRGTLRIPASATTIGASAFARCSALDTLLLTEADSLTAIGAYAFADCRGLTGRLDLPPALTSLGDGAFAGCSGLESLTLPPRLRDLPTNAFAGCSALTGTLRLNAGLTAVGASAFDGCTGLTAIDWPAGLRSIGASAFHGCTAIEGTLALPDGLTTLGEGAFAGCTGLESVTLPTGLAFVEAATFAGCTGLTAITLLAATPPHLDATALTGVDRKKLRIYIPSGAKATYRKAEGWKDLRLVEGKSAGAATASMSLPADTMPAPTEGLIPVPERITPLPGNPLVWLTVSGIDAPPELANEREHAERILRERAGVVPDGRKSGKRIRLTLTDRLADDEAYVLEVNEHGVDIEGRTAAGVFYGLMTLEQLMTGDRAAATCTQTEAVRIDDSPRTHVRELMVDPARIFIPFPELMAFVPEMARYKLNSLHLHLVDDQAWRIEIKSYPKLTEEGSARVGMDDMAIPVSGFYTQEQMRELVAFAARYHVMVIPEIEMPGHEVAAIHCYPQLTCGAKQVPVRTTCGVSDDLLCPGEEFVYEFLGNVFRELADVFPSPYVHLGGDEAGNPALGCWTDCQKCRALKRRLGITSTDRSENWKLQKYMFDRVIDTLRTRHGKTPMFWYETDFKEIQEGCVTFAWRHGLTRQAAEAAIANRAKIMFCPGEHCYLDYPMAPGDMPEVNWGMPVTSLRQTYALDPAWGLGDSFERNNLFGVAGTLWSECINSPERIYYQAYPRALALAEAGWSRQKNRSWPSFLKRLKPLLLDMQRRGISFSIPEE